MNFRLDSLIRSGYHLSNSVRTEDMSHEVKCIIWCLGGMESLMDKGLLTGPRRLTPQGKRIAKKLEDEGFHPDEKEIELSMLAIRRMLEGEGTEGENGQDEEQS